MSEIINFQSKIAGGQAVADRLTRKRTHSKGERGYHNSFDAFIDAKEIDRDTADDETLARLAIDYWNATLRDHEEAREFVSVTTFS